MPLLRIVAALGLACVIYNLVLEHPWSRVTLVHWGSPAVLLLFCLCVQPELRPPTFLNRIGRVAHSLLVFFILPLALFALVIGLLHR